MKSTDRVLEASIKKIVINHLLFKGNELQSNDETFIISEFSIANFSRRVDLVLAKKDNFYAFEIKSEFDSLVRLEGQVNEYIEHFDKVIVVTVEKYVEKVLKLTPVTVAVWELSNFDLKVIRRGKINKINNKRVFLKMMTHSELLNLAKKSDVKLVDKKRKVVEELLYNLPLKTLRKSAVEYIKCRYKKRGSNYYDKFYFEYKKNKKTSVSDNKKEPTNIGSFINVLGDL